MMGYEAHIAGLGDRPLGARWQARAIRWIKRALGGGDRRAARRRGGRGARGGAARARERRRHRQPPHHRARAGGHRGHRRVRLLRAHPVRPLRRLHARSPRRCSRCRSCARPSGGVATLLGGGYLASGAGGPRPPARALPAARACASTRREGAGEVQTPVHRRGRRPRCGSATASTSATPRRASCASASTACTWSSGGRVVDAGADLPRRGPHFL